MPCVATDVGDLRQLAGTFPACEWCRRRMSPACAGPALDNWPAQVEQARRDAVKAREFFGKVGMIDETQAILRRLVAPSASAVPVVV